MRYIDGKYIACFGRVKLDARITKDESRTHPQRFQGQDKIIEKKTGKKNCADTTTG